MSNNSGNNNNAQKCYKRVIGETRSSSCSNGIRGFKLNLRKLSFQRLRIRVLSFFRVWNKWKKSLRKLRFIASSSAKKGNNKLQRCYINYSQIGGGGERKGCFEQNNNNNNCRLRSLGRTNSFYTEAIADCLEFIKRNSVSVDGDDDDDDDLDEAAPIAAAVR